MLIWNRSQTDAAVQNVLDVLGEEYPIAAGECGVNIVFEIGGGENHLSVVRNGEIFHVTCGSAWLAGRGAGLALAGLEAEETCCFRSHGILFDCTRTKVMRVDYFKRWLRRLSLFGYNLAMLYTKDAYQLPGENYFGYMRGAYSQEEIRELGLYAEKLGIEMIASIQALGHLEPILRWEAYAPLRDTANVILADHEESYVLLEKMIRFWSEALPSRRIHLGMDETFDLGLGRHLKLHGYEEPISIYNRHLEKLCGICRKFGLNPIIWNDMYFRYAHRSGDYYENDSAISEDVARMIPAEAELSYWDYYHRDVETYCRFLQSTEKLNGKTPIMASGIWTWSRLWCDYEQTFSTVEPCIAACRKQGIRDFIHTLWGDDGAYCDFESAFAGLAWSAELVYHETPSDDRIRSLYRAVCGTDYDLQVALGSMEMISGPADHSTPRKLSAPAVLWDDPLMGIIWHEAPFWDKEVWQKALAHYRDLAAKAEPFRDDCNAGCINHAWNVLDVLAKKVELRMLLVNAYEKRDLSTLHVIAEKYIPDVITALEGLNESFRRQWLRGYKHYGLECIQIRLAGIRERYVELGRRLDEYLEGSADTIEELDLKPDPIGIGETRYLSIVTGNFML